MNEKQKPEREAAGASSAEVPETKPAAPAAAVATPGLLSAEEILGASDLSHVDVEVPEWTPGWAEDNDVEPRKIRLQELSAGEAIAITD